MGIKVRQEYLRLARDRVRSGEQSMAEALAQARASERRMRALERVAAEAMTMPAEETRDTVCDMDCGHNPMIPSGAHMTGCLFWSTT